MNPTTQLEPNSAHPRGSALIVALAVVALLASISTALLMEMTNRAKAVEVDLEDIKAFEAAEAGLDAALNDINSAPVYQPKMSAVVKDYPAATRLSNGQLTDAGTLDTSFTGNVSGTPLTAPQSGKPVSVHVTRKAGDNNSTIDINNRIPGCLGTSEWKRIYKMGGSYKNTVDLDGNGRPSWRSSGLVNNSGLAVTDTQGKPVYFEPFIVPQALGNVAFYTYAIDWFHDDTTVVGQGYNTAALPSINPVNKRNKYTIYSTGIHRGLAQSGVTTAGRVVTLEVVVQAMDKDFEQLPWGALDIQIKAR
ncbi:MAG TPA: hypothetical protein VGP72_10050 [Planctomycetota bacterium]|jgi:Tfp pilus assembly protein PilX